MIGARGIHTETGESVIVLGLTPENVVRLNNGQPMYLKNETHPFIPEGWIVTIIVGINEETIMNWLKQEGQVITPWEDPHRGPQH